MKKVTLGLNGPKVSVIGLGGMSFSDFYGKTTEKNTHNILDKAIDYGINLIDTANIYGLGQSEVAIGNYFKKNLPLNQNSLFVPKLQLKSVKIVEG